MHKALTLKKQHNWELPWGICSPHLQQMARPFYAARPLRALLKKDGSAGYRGVGNVCFTSQLSPRIPLWSDTVGKIDVLKCHTEPFIKKCQFFADLM